MIIKNLDYLCLILVFLSSLIFIIAVGIPNLLMNDSVLTVEQLHQLSSGEQIRTSEGKYGLMENGTEYRYFTARNGVLLYSLILPIISLPAFFLINFLGIHFNFIIFGIWSLLSLIWILLFGDAIRVDNFLYSRFSKYLPVIILLIFFLFLLNLFLYIPNIPLSLSYYEIPAVILTNHILFAFIAVIVFSIFRLLNYPRLLSLEYTMSVIFCSSFLFWSTDAKDHILVAFLLSWFIFFLLSFIVKNKGYYYYFCIITIGIITWTRPEIGICLAFVFIMFSLYWIYSRKILFGPAILKYIFLSLIFSFIGFSPFFINNLLITGNPLVPAFISEKLDYNISENISDNETISAISKDLYNSKELSNRYDVVMQFPYKLITNPGTILKILFNPDSGSIGLFAVDPLPMICFLFVIFTLINKSLFELNLNEMRASVIFCCLSVFLIGVYLIINFDGLNVSHGVVPDIRYLSPAYLPLNFLSLIILRPILSQPVRKNVILKIFVSWLILMIFFSFTLFLSPVRIISVDNDLFTLSSLGISLLFLVGVILYIKNRVSSTTVILLFCIVIIIPLFWQIDALLYYSCRRPLGYDFWLPITRYFYSTFYGNFCI